MDPDCAICGGAANLHCECESKALEQAISQAERRMMQSVYQDIRDWARGHAQDYILSYFNVLSERRKATHSAHLERITQHAYMHYRSPPHPQEIANAQAALKRGIDEDWQTSVQRYPEVLEYFFSLVELTLPPDDDDSVKDPPLSALRGGRKAGRRGPPVPATIASGPFHPPPDRLPSRTPPPPPPPQPVGRRTPGPRGSRHSYHPPAPPTYYGPPAW